MSFVDSLPNFENALELCVDYNQKNGLFFWSQRPELSWVDGVFNKRFAGNEIKNVCKWGYKRIGLTRGGYTKAFKAHRVAWLLTYGSWPTLAIDHIDGDKENNKIENLREVTPQQNAWNRSTSPLSKTGHKGVDFVNGKYRARGYRAGVRHNLGTYESIDGAIEVYKKFTKGFQNEFYRV